MPTTSHSFTQAPDFTSTSPISAESLTQASSSPPCYEPSGSPSVYSADFAAAPAQTDVDSSDFEKWSGTLPGAVDRDIHKTCR